MTADEITPTTIENQPPVPTLVESSDVPAWAYVLPFAVFLIGTNLEGQAETPTEP